LSGATSYTWNNLVNATWFVILTDNAGNNNYAQIVVNCTNTTSTSTTTTTTTAAPIPCTTYKCSSNRGGYLYWTDCQTGARAHSLINGGKTKFISSRSYPTQEKGAKITIDEVSVYYL
jgi:hypothetical protein